MAATEDGDGSEITLEWFSSLPQIKPLVGRVSSQRLQDAVTLLRTQFSSRADVLAASYHELSYMRLDSSFTTALQPPPARYVPDPETLSGKLFLAVREALRSGSVEPVVAALQGRTASEKAEAINSMAGATTVLGFVCAGGEGPPQQELLRLLLAEGGDPNLPADRPVGIYPITSTHSVGTLRQLVAAGARLDAAPIAARLAAGHPTLSFGGAELRAYLEELGVSLCPPASEH